MRIFPRLPPHTLYAFPFMQDRNPPREPQSNGATVQYFEKSLHSSAVAYFGGNCFWSTRGSSAVKPNHDKAPLTHQDMTQSSQHH